MAATVGAGLQRLGRGPLARPPRFLLALLLILIGLIPGGPNGLVGPELARAISIKPADFDRLIMSCYLGGAAPSNFQSVYQSAASAGNQPSSSGSSLSNGAYSAYSSGQFGRQTSFSGGANAQPAPPYYASDANRGSSSLGNNNNNGGGASPSSSSSAATSFAGNRLAGGFLDASPGSNNFYNLGQTIPRANTIDNFIALLSKIEAANPRLANNPDQLIRSLLGRFRLDNYYYDVRSQTPISEQNRRQASEILPALMGQQQQQQQQYMNSDQFPENLLDQNEKCSMYFMLSHFIDKTGVSPNQPLGSQPVTQLAGPQNNQRPPVLQAAGAPYPAQSASQAYNSAGGTGAGGPNGAGPNGAQPRYPGPSPSFGSPATGNMNSFGAGINNNPDYSGKNNYGVNTLQPSGQYNQLTGGRARDGSWPSAGQYSGNPRPVAPYIDAATGRQANSNGLSSAGAFASANSRADDRLATEFGVVTLANQNNAALVLNRVLLGLLAATTPAQTLRQLAGQVYPTQQIMLNTPRLDEELDPLYAVTLADLWAISAIPKAGKPFDVRLLGDNGHWNDTMCPTAFTLERAGGIRFTTAELLGGIDGFNLGLLRRRLLSMRRNIKLSELLKMYYSRSGFAPQFAEFGVCNRQGPMLSYFDELHRQAENYLRLYQLDLPIKDGEISLTIGRLEAFKELTRQAAQQFTPQELCQSDSEPLYPLGGQDQCEIAKADLVTVLDSSPMANQLFQQLVVVKLAQRLGLAREASSLSILTNQLDTTGAGFGLNVIVRNSTNTAEVGCALARDQSASYQGGQVTDPTRLVEMFERALVNLDSEYLTRQSLGLGGSQGSSYSSSSSPSSASYRPSVVSTWFGSTSSGLGSYMYGSQGGGPRNTGGAKTIVWFNYGSQTRPSQINSGPTNWNGPSSSSSAYQNNDWQYKFYEAKKYLRENFRGASILALTNSREDVKPYVYNEDRDIFLDIPQGSSSLSSSSFSGLMSTGADYYPASAADPASLAMLSGPADQLVSKLLQRMCTIPALFQYPMCFGTPSDSTASVGYISPGRKQYWMMAPKTFFASRSVRLVFKVDGGRLRVCFGRKSNPDETFQRNPNKDQQSSSMFQSIVSNPSGGLVGSQSSTPAPTPSSSDYYTGMEYGVCKDVAPGQEIDFLVSEPCYKKSIAECEPFYFVIRETSNPGEGDPNYMCRDDGCKRFDQARFIMTHTGVSCSSALKSVKANHLLIMISALIAFYLLTDNGGPTGKPPGSSALKRTNTTGKYHDENAARLPVQTRPAKRGQSAITLRYLMVTIGALVATCSLCKLVEAQQANVYDYGQNRYGEKRGSYTPPEVLAIILVAMVILAGLALTIGLCYYVTKQRTRGMQPVEQTEY